MAKKVMKVEGKGKVDHSGMRKLFNQILAKAKGTLTLTENAHGAIQVKRDDGLLFSARADCMLITHPMYKGTGKKRERIYKHQGTKYDNLSQVPFEHVTLAMLEARVADKKSREDYHKEFYGKNPESSGLIQKYAQAKARIAKAEKVTAGKKDKATKKTAILRKAKDSKKKAPVQRSGKSKKAIRKVAEAPVAA